MRDFRLSIRRDRSEYVVTASMEAELRIPVCSLPPLAFEKCGRWLFQQFFADAILDAYRRTYYDRLLLDVPFELLDWPWRWLHDGFQFLALYHPLLLLDREGVEPPLLLRGKTPVRILLTIAEPAGKTGSFYPDKEEQIVQAFANSHADQVELQVERGRFDWRRLLSGFQNTNKRFHIWHHSGWCGPELALELTRETLNLKDLGYLLSWQRELRCLILNMHTAAPLASAVRELNVPFTMYFASTSTPDATLELMQAFYKRVLTHDLAIAGALAQLEYYLTHRQSQEWASTGMQASTTSLYLVQHREERPAFPVQVLLLKANPVNKEEKQKLEMLRLETEATEIKRIAREHQGCFVVHDYGATRPRDIAPYLLFHWPHILQFSGHGFSSGDLAFEQEDGEVARVSFQGFAEMLVRFKHTLRCVVLNACYTQPLAGVISQHIDCVIGMSEAISEGAAAAFSRGFYQALAAGESVGEAFRLACCEINMPQGRREGWMPQLQSRPGVNPDEVFFVPKQRLQQSD
ncbi:MAG TPA: CHAT domain-containing protein [Ktedonobacteraceae bacterium]|nr:CHAT domain-containing protein [Ktedonobacteraceae bacterium]